MEVKPIFSDDREEYLEHYGVKGMKWHQHIKARANFATDLAEAKREWSYDKGLHKVVGVTNSAVRAAHRNKLGTAKGYYKERGRIMGMRLRGIRHAISKGQSRVFSMFKRS